MNSLSSLYQRLGLNKENGLFEFTDVGWRGNLSQKIEYAFDKIKPNAFFCFNNEPLLFFFENPGDEKEIHRQCWNLNKVPVIFINTKSQLKIFNGFSFDNKTGLLSKLAEESELDRFSYQELVSGKLWREYEREFSERNRLDYKLLKNIEAARDILIKEQNLDDAIANKLIGRLIFTRYLIDRRIRIGYPVNDGLLTGNDFLELIRDRDALYDFFELLNTKFKGDLFPLNGEKDDVTHKNLEVLYRLFKSEEIKTGQKSLFDIYNFDIIPIEFISNIYEYFMGKDKQETNKSFYTPPFLVDYILKRTVAPHLKKETGSISCKVLDPSCGSGIFLVETLRLIILRFKELNPGLRPSQTEFKQAINRLLVENIYGIDKEKKALEIAVFSMYITLLDFFEEPKDINGFQFPHLMGTNFIEGDFFETKHPFNNKFGEGKDKLPLNFIIGNPPWGKVKSPYMKYIKGREKEEKKTIKVSNRQIAQAFMVRVSDFCSSHTTCAFIVTSKVLYNLQADIFRKYFIDNFFIDEVLEISSVRHQIFVKAVGPAAILTFRYAFDKNTENNKVEHIALKPNPMFSLFKSILIEKYDYKEIKQNFFKEYDWLWKVLVYGSVLDFHFIKRLHNKKFKSISIDNIITKPKHKRKKNDLIYGSKGICVGNKTKDANHLLDRQFIRTSKNFNDLIRYYINYHNNSRWEEPKVERPRKSHFFLPPMVLLKKGLANNFQLVASICEKEAVFTDDIFAIKCYRDNNTLENLLGLINSDLMTYFVFMSGSSTGIEREQVFNEELYPFPVVLENKIADKVKILLELHKKDSGGNVDEFKLGGYETKIRRVEKELNKLIFSLYKISASERDLLDYAFEISIPILKDKENRKPFNRSSKSELEEYAQLFIDHFSRFHSNKEMGYFCVEIYQTVHIAAMNFKVTPREPAEAISWRNDQNTEGIIELMAGLAFQKVSNKLFIQKDVKGLNKDSFYVIKPNQYKYWHRAIARLDIIEFENTMLESRLDKGFYEQDR
ncbi:class I SAM-dependent DNA methyltransferase [Acidobacteriota bacterium]